MGEKHIHRSPLDPSDRATTILCMIKNGVGDRTSPGCGSQDACGCDVTPTSRIVRIDNPSCVQESVVETVKMSVV